IFTTLTNAKVYKEMFISFFNYVEILISQKFQFQHIYNNGLGCIIVDLDLAQAKGLGKALKTIVPSKKGKEHLEHIIKSSLEKFNEPKIQDWISFYKTPWILASLIQAYTKIPTDLWNSMPFDTNIAKSAHASVNREGTKLKLRVAI
ncbi:19205_t:CDS:2, partial [Gigaspora margarita]